MRERTRTYRFAMVLNRPVAWWGRLKVDGLDTLPATGPLLVVGNHDSHWDPLMVGMAALRRRQIRALAKSTLWDVRGLGPILNGMGQIPIERGAGDAGALARAIETLRSGGLHRRLPRGHAFTREGAASPQRGRPSSARGAGGTRHPGRRSRAHPTSPASPAARRSKSTSSTPPVARRAKGRRRVSCRLGGWPRSASASPRQSPTASARSGFSSPVRPSAEGGMLRRL